MGILKDRSTMETRKVFVIGVIDAHYHCEVKVILNNSSRMVPKSEEDEKLYQFIFIRSDSPEWSKGQLNQERFIY